jgi:hypothetical protein
MKVSHRVIAITAISFTVFGQGGFSGPGRYEITNLQSRRVLDLDRNDQTTVIQFSPRGTDNQTWDIIPGPEGYVFLRNAMNGYALDAGGGGRAEPVRGIPFNGGPSQQWRLDPGKDGNALIVSRLGRTIDIPDGAARDGIRVQVFDVDGDSNQRFLLRRVGNFREWDDHREREREPARGGPPAVTCASNNGERVVCQVDARGGVQLLRQVSGAPCELGRTWGWDDRGIWVDRGCRGEFALSPPREESRGNRISCSSNNGERVYCQVDTRCMAVQLLRQVSGARCDQGRTWGWDRRGIWVDRGCRGEFAVVPER